MPSITLRKFRLNTPCAVLLVLGLVAQRAAHGGDTGGDTLQVHEWGTFTALQDEAGKALPGINIDDEPLPSFCHNLRPWVLARATSIPLFMMKGVPRRHPDVTLRLETPVIYFHPPAGETHRFSVDVDVKFRGGWLTEFYPQAEPDEPRLKENEFDFGSLTATTLGGLRWRGVQVGAHQPGPKTTEHVWLAPRDVAAADVSVKPQPDQDTATESERFLFYRGVGNRPVPLRVRKQASEDRISIVSQCSDVLATGETSIVEKLWLVETRPSGETAYRAIGPLTLSQDTTTELANVSARFEAGDFAPSRMPQLQSEMHAALQAGGLADDEATAMLATWQRAYFRSPGLRLFFLVPRRWTDAVLPLKLSRKADVSRVMMGRVELISREQRRLLAKLPTLSPSDGTWVSRITNQDGLRRFYEGRSDFGDLGVPIPEDYRAYLDMGRFRNALVLAEQRARPNPGLAHFIATYGLSGGQ